MALRDPVAVYNAANNVEAHLVCNALVNAGVEARVTEDVSQEWTFSVLSEVHKPRIWVEREDIERAKEVLEDFEYRAAELQDTDVYRQMPWAAPIRVVCEDCGRRTTFPPTQRGSVQHCRHCGAYVDVGEDEVLGEWPEPPEEEEAGEWP